MSEDTALSFQELRDMVHALFRLAPATMQHVYMDVFVLDMLQRCGESYYRISDSEALRIRELAGRYLE